ncbi:MAG: hypothetical protein NTV98_03565 [Candidatus Roizmanbacteria bacterium]|nr:hypothetical protein [Candidatus Roizmanbacteria bacterium]
MPPEKIATPQEKGKILCETFSALSKKSFPLLNIYPQPGSPPIALKDEYGDTKNWNKFVQFPSELNGLIPGSYVNPSLFLETLGKTEGSNDNIKKMISTEMGTAEEPIFTFDQGNFGLRIMNGMANKHALSMSRLAQ